MNLRPLLATGLFVGLIAAAASIDSQAPVITFQPAGGAAPYSRTLTAGKNTKINTATNGQVKVDVDVTGLGTVATSTTSATATALAANGANCSAGQAPLGVDDKGAVEGCWTPFAVADPADCVSSVLYSDGDYWGCWPVTSIFTEQDPQVGTITSAGSWCTTDGTHVNCASTLPEETDPEVASVTSGKWCRGTGSQVTCDQTAPAGVAALTETVLGSIKGLGSGNGTACAAGYVVSGFASSGAMECSLDQTGGSDYTLAAAQANTLGGVKGTGVALVCSGTNKATGFDSSGALQCAADVDTTKVSTLTASHWCTTDGTNVVCDTDAPVLAEDDPQVASAERGKWCTGTDAGNGIVCDKDAPVAAETDPEVISVIRGMWCTGADAGNGIVCDKAVPIAAEVDPEVVAVTRGAWCTGVDAGNGIICDKAAPVLAEADPLSIAKALGQTNGQLPGWNGDAGAWAPIDSKIGTLTNTKWCTSNGTSINCISNTPTEATEVTCTGCVETAAIQNSNYSGLCLLSGGSGSNPGWGACGGMKMITSIVTTNSTDYASLAQLSWTVSASQSVSVDCFVGYLSAAVTTGIGLALSGPEADLALYSVSIWKGHSVEASNEFAWDSTDATDGVDSINTPYYAWIKGFALIHDDGTLSVRVKSEVLGSQVSVLAGSWCRVE